MDPLSDTALAGLHDMVLAHVYGLGELDDLWNNPEVENIDCNGAGVVLVTFAGGLVKEFPPVAATLESPVSHPPAKTMTSPLHVAPRPRFVPMSQILIGAPPATPTFSRPMREEKPIQRPSGEKKGARAPLVPSRSVVARPSSRRTLR